MNQLNTILPVSLRALCRFYYSSDSQAKRFVVISKFNTTGLEVRMGTWGPTSIKGRKPLVTLYKSGVNLKDCFRIFSPESINVLRQDEFEWLLQESVTYPTYDHMVEYASSGNTTAITIYRYLLELAELFHLKPEFIFEFINKFMIKYNPDELIKKPW